MQPPENIDIVNVRITYKKARVPLMEAVSFKDKRSALAEIRSLCCADECILLQTCNRIELYLVNKEGKEAAKVVSEYLAKRSGTMAEEVSRAIEVSLNKEALRHILRVASGLESMVVGEDQVLNQVWDAYLEAEAAKTAGPVLKNVFNKAANVGKRVRNETGVNKGAVSVGSVAVELAASLLGNFEGKNVLVMGAGEIGTLVAKALARRSLSAIFIANRTYERALKLAEKLSGKAIKFDKLGEALLDADVVICSTSAPHYLLTKNLIHQTMGHRRNPNELLIIDISNPRNVEMSVQDVEGVQLYNIDDLQMIAEKNKEERQKSAEQASKIVDEELILLERNVKAQSVRSIISSLLSHAEEVRKRELTEALNMLENVDEKEKKIIDDLTRILLKQTFIPLIENLRIAAINNDLQLIEMAVKLFGMEPD
jgi:glutamyl-tRNA reductase